MTETKYKVGDIILISHTTVYGTELDNLYLINEVDSLFYRCTLIDTLNEGWVSGFLGDQCSVRLFYCDISPCASLAFTQEPLSATGDKLKCTCAIFDVVNFGCKCGGY